MGRTHRNQYRMPERGKIAALPEFQFLLEIAREIVMPRELDGGAEGRVGLHKNFARRFATARAARYLRKQLERPFARAEIRHVQREIGVDDSDESDVRKMKAFRDHLRADENVDGGFRDTHPCASLNRRPSGARRHGERYGKR